MRQNNKRRLRNYLINKNLQFRIMVHSLIYMVIAIIITLGTILFPILRDMFLRENIDIQYQAAQGFLLLMEWLMPFVILLFLVFALHQILITHKICGPLVNFSYTFSRLVQGDFTRRVRIRRTDFLTRECEKINEMIDGLSSIICRTTDDHNALVAELEQAKREIGTLETTVQFEEVLDGVMQKARAVSDDLSAFKLDAQGR